MKKQGLYLPEKLVFIELQIKRIININIKSENNLRMQESITPDLVLYPLLYRFCVALGRSGTE